MTKRRTIVIVVFAVLGAALGAGVGALVAPTADRYTVSTNVAMLPASSLTTAEASSFWDVLTRGQVSRTAAIVYDDSRWLTSAAKAAGVQPSQLTLTAAALPETTIVAVTVTANTPGAAEAALSDVLTTAAPQVASVTAPFQASPLWPPKDSAHPIAVSSRTQVAGAGGLAGLLIGGGIGWLVSRRRSRSAVDDHVDGVDHVAAENPVAGGDPVAADEQRARHQR
jgi:hypothetical protein